MKVLIIGLDGATWNVLDDYLLENHMPNLKKLKNNGYSGILQSTEPPLTAAAWTTCITGCQPKTTGVIGWHEYCHQTDSLQISSSNSCLVPNMWQELSEQGYKIVSINVPWTYPCCEVNGIMVAGYGCPDPHQSQLTYPIEFRNELLKCIPDYQIMAEWNKADSYNLSMLDGNLKCVERSFEQRYETARLASEKVDWDIMMIQFHDTDWIQHHVWSYLDKNTRDQYPQQRDRLFKTFEKLDKTIGDVLDLASDEKLMISVVSDHGLCRQTGKIKPNVLLSQWGYLKHKTSVKRMIQRWSQKFFPQQAKSGVRQPSEFKFDWANSRAMVISLAINGHLYVNLKNHQQTKMIKSDSNYTNLIAELRQKFSEMTDPDIGGRLFDKVGTVAEIYGLNITDSAKFGDLVLVPPQGMEISLSGFKHDKFVERFAENTLKGTHCSEGIFVFSGNNIKNARDQRSHIVNVAPTVYAALGAKLPLYLDGKVIDDIFVEKKQLNFQTSRMQTPHLRNIDKKLSPQEEAEITKQLSALGYVE